MLTTSEDTVRETWEDTVNSLNQPGKTSVMSKESFPDVIRKKTWAPQPSVLFALEQEVTHCNQTKVSSPGKFSK